MKTDQLDRLTELVVNHQTDLLSAWVDHQLSDSGYRRDLMNEAEVRKQSREFIGAFTSALRESRSADITEPPWDSVRSLLSEISRSRARHGFSPTETATFVFSIKQPIFNLLQQNRGADGAALTQEVWQLNTMIDQLGLWTIEVFQKGREEVILRQNEDLLELSTPVVELWQGILALPLIGTLDSARTQVVMQSLLERIVETGAAIAVIDITGVPTVDTLVAQHLLKTVAAARLMGADCIISGIRPQIAQTIVHLGVELSNVATKATLADAFELALKRSGLEVGLATRRKRANHR